MSRRHILAAVPEDVIQGDVGGPELSYYFRDDKLEERTTKRVGRAFDPSQFPEEQIEPNRIDG